MKTELEKCLSGELYNCHDEYFIKGKARASELCRLYNATPYSDRAGRRKLLEEMFASIGDNVTVGDGFTCGFGTNIEHAAVDFLFDFVVLTLQVNHLDRLHVR